MSTTTLTHKIACGDWMPCLWPALGNFRSKKGHAPIVDIFTHLSAEKDEQAKVTCINDVVLLSRDNCEFTPSRHIMIPVVLPMHMVSTFAPSLDTSAVLQTTCDQIEIALDYQTEQPSSITLAHSFPYGSLDRPV